LTMEFLKGNRVCWTGRLFRVSTTDGYQSDHYRAQRLEHVRHHRGSTPTMHADMLFLDDGWLVSLVLWVASAT
jgi:hypothetical protein